MARPRRRSNRLPQNKGPEHRINERIRVPEVRLVGDNVEQGIFKTSDALKMAYRLNLDLVEIAEKARPPVCRIIDYSKFLYEKKRKEKEIKAKTQKTVVKEIRFTPNTDDHDFEFKSKHAQRFLEEGSKVKAYVQFKGRAIVFKERGELLLLKFAERLTEFGALEQMPRLEGKRMFAFISPKKVVKKKVEKESKKPKREPRKPVEKPFITMAEIKAESELEEKNEAMERANTSGRDGSQPVVREKKKYKKRYIKKGATRSDSNGTNKTENRIPKRDSITPKTNDNDVS